MNSTLHLTLKKQWFDMILSGEKKEEYREIKPYWLRRFLDMSDVPAESPNDYKNTTENIMFDFQNGHNKSEVIKRYYCKLKQFDTIRFTNGYAKNAPTFDIECKGIRIGKGFSEWGGSYADVFILSLGNIITPSKP